MAKKKRTSADEKRLRAAYNKGSYKTLDKYLDAVYRKNKDLINEKIKSDGYGKSSKMRFKQAVIDFMDEGLTANQALDKLQRSRVFTSEREHYEANVFKALRNDKDLFNKFRKLAGWNEKIDVSLLNYVESDDKTTLYRYNAPNGSIVFVRFSKSPTRGLGASIGVFV